jgi:glyoxylase-like metal-dependent hydrolase (beta-lactamase superfamily II)
LESVGEGLWAFISTPLSGDYTTVCNGGIIAGTKGILVVEAFQTPEGARWIAEQARDLTGRWPTHILITHYHGDHSSGLEGLIPTPSPTEEQTPPELRDGRQTQNPPSAAPQVLATPTTRDLKERGFGQDTPDRTRSLWADVVLVGEDAPREMDLGGVSLRVTPRRGHTPSDLTLEIPGHSVVWSGDLVWNGMFPNYMDAVPSQLSRAVRALAAQPFDTLIPGHGPLAGPQELGAYMAVIDGVEETARRAREEGWTAEEAAARHRIPESLGDWTLFSPSYYQRAVEAWMKEWG